MATRIVSSTIVRPDIESRVADSTSGRKRSLPGSPEPHRRHSRPSISSRLSSSNINNNKTDSNATTTLTAEAAAASSGTVGQAPQHSPVSETAAASGSGSGSGSLEAGNSNSNSNADAMEDSEVQDKKGTEDRTQRNNKRPRLALNPAEDAKRGRRMMGMILGTLGQFKKQQQQQQVPDLGSTAGGASGVGRDAPVASGVASREAVQKRVQEKLQRERELNEELRKKEVEERRARMERAEAQRRRDPPSVPAPRGAAVKRRRNEVKWENGYILTETRPRLRYMPKILNDTTRKRLQERTKDADDKKDTSSAFSKAELNEDAITLEAGMDLDGEDMVVDQEVVMDVKEKEEDEEEEGKDGDEDRETTKTTGEDDHASKTPIFGSAFESLTTATSSRTVNDDDNVSDDVDMSVAARDVESDQVKGGSPAEDTATKTSTEETAGSDDSRVKSDLINISLV